MDVESLDLIRQIFREKILSDLNLLIQLYQSDESNCNDNNSSAIAVKISQVVEKVLLFGLHDVKLSWNVCEFMIAQHKSYVILSELIQDIPKSNIGKFKCFVKLILLNNKFASYWKDLFEHKDALTEYYHNWAIVNNSTYYEPILTIYNLLHEPLQFPFNYLDLDQNTYITDKFGCLIEIPIEELPQFLQESSKSKPTHEKIEKNEENINKPDNLLIIPLKKKKSIKTKSKALKKTKKNKNKIDNNTENGTNLGNDESLTELEFSVSTALHKYPSDDLYDGTTKEADNGSDLSHIQEKNEEIKENEQIDRIEMILEHDKNQKIIDNNNQNEEKMEEFILNDDNILIKEQNNNIEDLKQISSTKDVFGEKNPTDYDSDNNEDYSITLRERQDSFSETITRDRSGVRDVQFSPRFLSQAAPSPYLSPESHRFSSTIHSQIKLSEKHNNNLSKKLIKNKKWDEWVSKRNINYIFYDELIHDNEYDSLTLRKYPHILPVSSLNTFNYVSSLNILSYKGALYKKGHKNKKWKKRYFDITDGNKLFYHSIHIDNNNNNTYKRKGEIDIKNIYMLSSEYSCIDNKEYIIIGLYTETRKWYLCTSNEQEAGKIIGVLDNRLSIISNYYRNKFFHNNSICIISNSTDTATTDNSSNNNNNNNNNTYNNLFNIKKNDNANNKKNNIYLNGWLYKCDRSKKKWNKRWWLLNTNYDINLRYFEENLSNKNDINEINKKCKGQIDLNRMYYVGPCLNKLIIDKYPLALDICTDDRIYNIACDRIEELELWYNALKSFINKNNKNMNLWKNIIYKNHVSIKFNNLKKKNNQEKRSSINILINSIKNQWIKCYAILCEYGLFYFDTMESYQTYRRSSIYSQPLKFNKNEGVLKFDIKKNITCYRLIGSNDSNNASIHEENSFALYVKKPVTSFKGNNNNNNNNGEYIIIKTNSSEELEEWLRSCNQLEIDNKILPANSALLN